MKPVEGTLVIASHNEGKVAEIRALLAPFALDIVSAASLSLPEPEETGNSFAANAALKSEAAARASGHWALADDSGLCVDALEGAPGIYSARWAGPTKDFTLAACKIVEALAVKRLAPDGAAARFVCVLALTSPEGETERFEGVVQGSLTLPARGDKGFGYDPIFTPDGQTQTFAEIEPGAKHAISHRARAFAQLQDRLQRPALAARA